MLSPTFSAQTPTPFWKERTRGYANNELSEIAVDAFVTFRLAV
jgi:hypothetical protein